MYEQTDNTVAANGICDLHTHSYFSDGTESPASIVAQAKQAHLRAVALTDHNTVDGLDDFMHAGKEAGVNTVPGIELSTDWEGTELHILALFLPHRSFPAARAYTNLRNARKEQSNQILCHRLNAAGYAVNYDTIRSKTNASVPNRAHFASALVDLGYFDSVKAAFHTLLDRGAPFYQPTQNPDALQTIRIIRSWGAIAVLAHPLLQLQPPTLQRFLALACSVGLCGMEAWYARFTDEQTQILLDICHAFGVLPSGGSDYHGDRKPDIALGTGCHGNLHVPYEAFQNLQRAAHL